MLARGVGEDLAIDNQVFLTIKRYIQTSPFHKESGGVLIGREPIEGNRIVVEHITAPLPNDHRGRYRFDRRDVAHVDYYNKLNEEVCVYTYVGEWHTHPEKMPKPSAKDLQNWSRIWNEDFARTVQYHMIAGTDEIGVWAFGPMDMQVSLMTMWKWGNLEL